MSKYRVTECPGCGLPFREGRSLSQHFIWSPGCKQQANSFPHHVSSSIPHHSTLSTTRFMSDKHCSVVDDINEDRASLNSSQSIPSTAFSYPDADTEEDDNDHVVARSDERTDDHLQNVVSFPVAFSNAAYHEVELLKLLNQIGAPNHAFESVMSWAKKADDTDYHFQPSPKCYESQIRNLTELVGMNPCRPTISQVSLEPDDLVLDVVVFPFATMLSSLLNCPMLNKLDNLVVNPQDRYGRCPGERLGDVNSAQWYQDTYDEMITDPDKDFLCPIIFAMDKTVISEISHLSVNVILFSTTLFTREVSILLLLLFLYSGFYNILSCCIYRLGIKVLLGGP